VRCNVRQRNTRVAPALQKNDNVKENHNLLQKLVLLTNVMSRDAAAALMWRLGCFTELEQSRARANVPTDLEITRNWSICLSVRWCDGVHTNVSKSSRFRLSASSEIHNAHVCTRGTMCHAMIKESLLHWGGAGMMYKYLKLKEASCNPVFRRH
jgi:hypothetical protein